MSQYLGVVRILSGAPLGSFLGDVEILGGIPAPSSIALGTPITATALSAGGVLFAGPTGLLAVDLGAFGLKWNNASKTLTTNLIVANGIEVDTITTKPGQVLDINGAIGQNVVITSQGIMQYVATSGHRFYSAGFVTQPLQIDAALVTVNIGSQARFEDRVQHRAVATPIPTPPAPYVNFGFRIIAGVRTPVFKGQDGIEHTITFV